MQLECGHNTKMVQAEGVYRPTSAVAHRIMITCVIHALIWMLLCMQKLRHAKLKFAKLIAYSKGCVMNDRSVMLQACNYTPRLHVGSAA